MHWKHVPSRRVYCMPVDWIKPQLATVYLTVVVCKQFKISTFSQVIFTNHCIYWKSIQAMNSYYSISGWFTILTVLWWLWSKLEYHSHNTNKKLWHAKLKTSRKSIEFSSYKWSHAKTLIIFGLMAWVATPSVVQ